LTPRPFSFKMTVMEAILSDLTNQVISLLEKKGLYAVEWNFDVMSDNEEVIEKVMNGELSDEGAIKSGLANLHMSVLARIGDVAWSDRVLNPEVCQERREFDLIVPEAKDVDLDEIRREMDEWKDK